MSPRRSNVVLDDDDGYARAQAAMCLKNAHGHIGTAYSQIQGLLDSPARRERCVRETLDAVDWIRRALEHMSGAREQG